MLQYNLSKILKKKLFDFIILRYNLNKILKKNYLILFDFIMLQYNLSKILEKKLFDIPSGALCLRGGLHNQRPGCAGVTTYWGRQDSS